MQKNIVVLFGILLLTGCAGLQYGMGGGIPANDWARGSRVSSQITDAAWKECDHIYSYSSLYSSPYSANMEKCMTDKGFIRLSEIKRRQKNYKNSKLK